MSKEFPITPAGSGPFWVCVGLAFLMLGLTGLMVYLAVGTQRTRVEVSPAGLRIRGDLYGRLVPRHALRLEVAMPVDLKERRDLRPVLRTNGTGLPGYASGWFRLRNREKALVFLTEPTSVLYVPTTLGYSVLLSLENPEEVLAALRGG
ncbi:MAG: hypothetical protein FJX77_16820 [Armatimonadetes bacterium]|nr:hypothetical protein [Armatimonadota bacterium]